MSKTKSFFSLLAGLAAGAALGMLYAPDKGWKTRARVKKAASNSFDDLKDELDNLGDRVDETTAEAKDSLKSLKEALRAKGAEIKEGTRTMLLEQLDRLEKALRQQEEAAAEEERAEEPAAEEAGEQ